MSVHPVEAVIVCCADCQQKNRVSDPFMEGRVWKCASCSSTLLHNFSRPGDRFLQRCISQLQHSLVELEEIKTGVFAGKKIIKIQAQVDYVKSKVEAWKEHLEYIARPEEKELARRYHASDLLEIEGLYGLIVADIERKSWLRKFIENSASTRSLLNGFSDLIAIAGGVLVIMGVPNNLLGLASRLNQYRIGKSASN